MNGLEMAWGFAIGLLLYPVLVAIDAYKDWKWKYEFRKWLRENK